MATGLSQELTDELMKYFGIKIVFDNNTTAVTAYPAFADKVVKYESDLTTLTDELKAKDVVYTGLTETKNQMKHDVAIFYDPICGSTEDFAIDNGHDALAKAVHFTEYSIYHLKDLEVLPQIEAINDAIKPFLSDTKFKRFGIDATMLATGLKKAQDFNGEIGKNTSVQQQQIVAGQIIEDLFKPMRADNKSLTRLIKWYKTSNNAFYKLYEAANEIHHTGNRITQIDGNILIAGTTDAVPGAYFKNLQTGKIVYADILGHYLMEKFKPGLYAFEIGAPGFVSIQQIIKVVAGKHYSFDFELKHV